MKLKSYYADYIHGHYFRGDPNVKSVFLDDALRFLRTAGRILKADGITLKAKANASGNAGSGEVYASIIIPDSPYNILAEIGTSALRGALGRTSDGVIIMLQWRARRERERDDYAGSIIVGSNIYLDPNMSAEEFAQEIRSLASRHIGTTNSPLAVR